MTNRQDAVDQSENTRTLVKTDGKHPADKALKYVSVFLLVFGFLGWPLAVGVILDGAPLIALGVFFAASVIFAAGVVGWMVHDIVAAPKEAQVDG